MMLAVNNSNNDANVVYFAFSSNEPRHPNQVVKADFGVYVRPVSDPDPTKHTWILVYEAQERKLLRKKRITYADVGWHRFDMKQQVQQWITNSSTNHGLRVLCTDAQGAPLAVTTPRNETEESYVSRILPKFYFAEFGYAEFLLSPNIYFRRILFRRI